MASARMALAHCLRKTRFSAVMAKFLMKVRAH
jgi:hypothetical protein